MEYISDKFKSAGLLPKGNDGYYQEFEINEGLQINDGTTFSINDVTLEAGKDYFPFPYSARKSIEASPAIAIQEADMPWFVDLEDILDENKQNPHFDLNDYIKKNAQKAYDRAATAVVIYNTSADADNLSFNPKDRSETLPLPVIYVNKDAATKYFSDATATLNIKLNVDIGEKKRKGHNVVGYIDNGAPTTVVLGAHFDHLGYGEDGNSMLRTGEKLIHNGADDNASGTAALIELARILKTSKSKNNNYLFIAFSGEELGLYGSKYFTEHPTVALATINYMINMDMVGRLNDSTKSLAVGGFGTSPAWATVIKPNEKKLPFVIKIDSSGSGPSDHTSFYRKDIPVLFFFTGQHKDYHRPTDTPDKIDYEDLDRVADFAVAILTRVESGPTAPEFTKVDQVLQPGGGRAGSRVFTGTIPDYSTDAKGLLLSGVIGGGPAEQAGLQKGDVIVEIAGQTIANIYDYTYALDVLKIGQPAKVIYVRNGERKETMLTPSARK